MSRLTYYGISDCLLSAVKHRVLITYLYYRNESHTCIYRTALRYSKN